MWASYLPPQGEEEEIDENIFVLLLVAKALTSLSLFFLLSLSLSLLKMCTVRHM